ncbi:radical SAM/SPASM domain-containing protein [Patescibacteria group bacterium]
MKINKGNYSLNSGIDKLSFNLKRGRGHLLFFLIDRFKWHFYPRFHKVSKFPSHVDVEISSICNMKCPMCYTITAEFKKSVKTGLMHFNLFKKIIDECVKYNVYSIRLSLRGESFLHPRIFDMIKYAKEKGIKEVSTLTNNLALNPGKFKKLVELELDWLTISFDGLGKTYESIRKPAKFKDSFNMIKKYHQIKKEMNCLKPVIKVQSVWPAIKNNPKKYYNTFSSYVDMVASNPLIDYLRKDEDIEYEENFVCPVLYQRLVIGSDGKVLLCSNDERGLYIVGDVNKQSLYSVWHGKKLNKARNLHLKHQGIKKLKPCKVCYLPRKTRKQNILINNRNTLIEKYTKRTEVIGK